MIKFTALIHKETGTVISYIDWLAHLRGNKEIRIEKEFPKNNFYTGTFNPIDIILDSDDFEIIYDSEFTTEELQKILKDDLDNAILYKIVKNIDSKRLLKNKYGIEV